MKNTPLVSVCIPVYNADQFIGLTIESVLNQTYSNLEIIVTDNCSTDNTPAVVNSFSDSRIKYFKNTSNLGVEANWNESLRQANGKYLKLLCADDIIYPECIEKQVDIFETSKNSDVVLVSSHKDIIDQNGKFLFTKKFPGKTGVRKGISTLKLSVRLGTNIIGESASGLFKADILNLSGLYNGENLYLIDMEFWSRLLLQGNLYVIDKVLYAFRISSDSLSSNASFAQARYFGTFVDKLFVDKRFKISSIDKMCSRLMAFLMAIGRNFMYLIYFNKK